MTDLITHSWVNGPVPELDQISMEFSMRKSLVDREKTK